MSDVAGPYLARTVYEGAFLRVHGWPLLWIDRSEGAFAFPAEAEADALAYAAGEVVVACDFAQMCIELLRLMCDALDTDFHASAWS